MRLVGWRGAILAWFYQLRFGGQESDLDELSTSIPWAYLLSYACLVFYTFVLTIRSPRMAPAAHNNVVTLSLTVCASVVCRQRDLAIAQLHRQGRLVCAVRVSHIFALTHQGCLMMRLGPLRCTFTGVIMRQVLVHNSHRLRYRKGAFVASPLGRSIYQAQAHESGTSLFPQASTAFLTCSRSK